MMTKQASRGDAGVDTPTPSGPRDFWLGRVDYVRSWRAMRRFSRRRLPGARDRIWLLEHDPVYTAGLSCRTAPLEIDGVPVVRSDRGGRMSYHGPGQLMAYPLVDLPRSGLTVKSYVRLLENAVIDTLNGLGLDGRLWPGRPGVFVGDAKIAFIGVRVVPTGAYHGLSLNVAMDTRPFQRIDPCGFPGLAITTLERLGVSLSTRRAGDILAGYLRRSLGASRLRVESREAAVVAVEEEGVFA